MEDNIGDNKDNNTPQVEGRPVEEKHFGKVYYTDLKEKEKEYKYINYLYLILYFVLVILLSGVLWSAVEMLFL